MWNYDEYKTWVKNRLIEIKTNLDFNDYDIEVYNEQDYAKKRSIKSKTITAIIKFLPSTLLFNVETQPIQMLVITEENGLSVANTIMTNFTDTYNFNVIPDGTTYIKHIYSRPSVLSNFNLIGIGLRTVLYVNTTLLILTDVMDITDLKVDGKDLDAISSTIGYTMSGDTQPFGSGHAITEKNYSTLVMTLNVACVKTDFTEKCAKIMRGDSTDKGNEDFAFTFYLGELAFSLNMKLAGATFTTAQNNVPSLQLTFTM